MINYALRQLDPYNPSSFVGRLRQRRFSEFIRVIDPAPHEQILDLGGAEGAWRGAGLEQQVTILNIDDKVIEPPFRYIKGDACATQLEDQSYDIVFSNSVIEHLGSASNQKAFAREVRRIATRAYWIQTPYKHFPIEPHAIFPFYTYMPFGCRKMIAKRWPLSHIRRIANPEEYVRNILLLNPQQFGALFDGASLYKEYLFGLLKSMTAYKLLDKHR